MPINQIRLSIFDQDVCIKTDSTNYLDLLKKTYRHFIVEQQPPAEKIPLCITFILEQGDQAEVPSFRVNNEEMYHSSEKMFRSEYIHGLILNSVFSKISSHYLFHSAVLSDNGKGIIICGDSGYGKTTLTLALIQRGFRFLSDEIAAIRRNDGVIDPFPRGLHIGEHSLDLLKLSIPIEEKTRWSGKYLVDIEDIFPGTIGESVKISDLFILKNATHSKLGEANLQGFKAIVSHINPNFTQQILAHPEIKGFQVLDESGSPCLLIRTNKKKEVIPFLEDLCKKNGILLLDLIKREEKEISFSTSLRYHTIPKSQAALELLHHFVGGHKTVLLSSNHIENSTKLLFELASLLENTHCYHITIGPFREMVDQISLLTHRDTFGTSKISSY